MSLELYQKVIKLLLEELDNKQKDYDRLSARYDLLVSEYIKLADDNIVR